MRKRLKILIDEADYRQLQRMAKQSGITVADWVREAALAAAQKPPVVSKERKLAAIRAAAALSLAPSPDIDQMNAEIEKD